MSKKVATIDGDIYLKENGTLGVSVGQRFPAYGEMGYGEIKTGRRVVMPDYGRLGYGETIDLNASIK